MNITQITPGIISVPPNGWGATERIIWEYKIALEKIGHTCDVKFLNDVTTTDIVHIHIANLAIEASKRGIPYIFTLHDHHVVLYGKESDVYKQNLEAMKKSIISFVPAEFLVDYFSECDKVFFLSHGVNIDYFKTDNHYRKEHKLLCIANNGYINNKSYDRKGFKYAIEAAKNMNLPITIAGPENNKNFFDENPDLLKYDKLNLILKNLNDEEILNLYKEHSIFIHPSELEAGHPNLTLLEALSCSLPVVGTYNGSKKLNGLVSINRNTMSLINGIKEVIKNYPLYVDETKEIRNDYSWDVICRRLSKMYSNVKDIKKEYTTEVTKNLYLNLFKNISKNENISKKNENIKIICHFINQPFVEITGNSNKKYLIEFWDGLGNLYHSTQINSNMWTKSNCEYYTDWTIKIYCENKLIYVHKFDCQGKKVYVHLESSSLGDTLAWFPLVEEFRKKHNCDLICSTFHNDFFEKKYPEIKFIKPGTIVHDLYAMYKIGWYYNEDNTINFNKNPKNFRDQHLQKTASDILGLDFKEIKPLIDFTPSSNPVEKKYFCIANHSTAQSKYWNNSTGWQDVVDYLKDNNYEVVLLSKEPDGYMGNKNPIGVIKLEDKSLYEIMNYLYHSEGFIGLGSGLSWLAWALNKKVFLISGFSRPNCEMKDCIRIFTPNTDTTCNGCFNDFRLDPSDWNWCPKFKGTDREFECTKSITSETVIDQLKKFFVN